MVGRQNGKGKAKIKRVGLGKISRGLLLLSESREEAAKLV